MSDQEDKKITFKKIIVYGVIGMLIFGLPAMSYFYLKKGFEWRVNAQNELKKDFGKIPQVPILWPDGTKENQLQGKLCVIHSFGANPSLIPVNKFIIDTGEELFKQFGYKKEAIRNDFRLVMIKEGGSADFDTYAETRPSASMSNWVWTGGLNNWSKVLGEGYQYYTSTQKVSPYPNYYALTDTSGIIRRFYNAEDKSDVERMVQHIAILLPRQF
ncbi:MAG: hypothetical protein RIR11_3042 [Bacteroidota bacterium]|jgi:hypothetical protein